MPAPFVLEELTLNQTRSLRDLYLLYCQNFPLPDEQESYPNFLRCLELNDDIAVQQEYGPYHEYYMAIRQYDPNSNQYDAIVGGLMFGVSSSAAHIANGYVCSVQVIYLFRTGSEELRRFLYAGKAMLEAEIESRALAACQRERFRAIVGANPVGRVAMFFEVNNPELMSREQIQIDRDLSQVHPALRYVMWTNHHTRPLAFRYVQPPLSSDQHPARYLNLFAVTAPLDHEDGGARLSLGPNGERGVPGPVLAEHLRRFFHISVLKGDKDALQRSCLPSPLPGAERTDDELLTVNQCCDILAAVPFVAVLPEQDPHLKRIKAQATELSVVRTRMLIPPPSEPVAGRWFRSRVPQVKRWMELVAPFLATGLLIVGGVGELISRLFNRHLHVPGREEMEVIEHATEIGLAVIIIWFSWRAFRKRQKARRADHSATALGQVLDAIAENVPIYHRSHPVIILRDILSDRAARHLRARFLLDGKDDARDSNEISGISQFIASRTFTPYLAELRLSGFNSSVGREVERVRRALQLFRAGAMQSMYRMTPWEAYYTCVFPILPRVLEGGGAQVRLEDFDRWVDTDVTAMLALADVEREQSFLTFRDAGGEVCLFVSHILNLPWDESDPGSPPEFLLPSDPRTAARPTSLEVLIKPYWNADAEPACGRMLAVVAQLAAVMRLMARDRQITTGIYCRCTVVIHVTAEPTIRLLQSLGFEEIPVQEAEAETETEGKLGGTLLILRIEPNAFTDLILDGVSASAAMFGLINEVARRMKET